MHVSAYTHTLPRRRAKTPAPGDKTASAIYINTGPQGPEGGGQDPRREARQMVFAKIGSKTPPGSPPTPPSGGEGGGAPPGRARGASRPRGRETRPQGLLARRHPLGRLSGVPFGAQASGDKSGIQGLKNGPLKTRGVPRCPLRNPLYMKLKGVSQFLPSSL